MGSVGGLLCLPEKWKSALSRRNNSLKTPKYSAAASPSIPRRDAIESHSITVRADEAIFPEAVLTVSASILKPWSRTARSRTHLLLKSFPKIIDRETARLFPSSSDHLYWVFRRITFPLWGPTALARNRPRRSKKERDTCLSAHAPMRAGLAPL